MSTIKFKNVYINDSFTLLGSKSKKPTIEKKVDLVKDDYYMGTKTIEQAESVYQKIALDGLMRKTKMVGKKIDLLIASDLQNQLFASHFNARNYNIPFLGIYSACSSFTEGLIIASSFLENNLLSNSILINSSHNLVNEKQFRFPIEYGALRKKCNSYSSTGAVSTFLSNKKSNIKIESVTIGKVIDMCHKDTNDMGACMAPAVAETIFDHLDALKIDYSYYDLILTGDLGVYGLSMMKEYIKQRYKINLTNVMDAGVLLYNSKENSEFAGGSGPICLPIILFSKILKDNNYKKILIVGSGALHSGLSANIKETMPSIAHAVSLEVSK